MTDNLPTRPLSPMMIRNLRPALPERGKIKIGEKGKMITSRSGNEFQPPVKLDHFRVTTLERGPDGNFKLDEDVHGNLGEKPTEIPVRLLYDDPVLNFPTRLACYVGRKLWCSGDGETAMRLDNDTNTYKACECPCPRSDPAYQGKDRCKMNGSLSVLIDGARGVGGVHKFRTTSYNSITGILSTMALLKSLTGGPLANIPLKLVVGPKQVTSPDGKQQTVYIVGLDFDGDMDDLREAGHRVALERAKHHVSIENIEREARLLLSFVPKETPLPGDTSDDIVEEFYPEQVAPATVETMQERPKRQTTETAATAANPQTATPKAEPAAKAATSAEPAAKSRGRPRKPTLYPVVDEAGEIVAEVPEADWIKAIVAAMETEGADFHAIWENNSESAGRHPAGADAQAAYDALCAKEDGGIAVETETGAGTETLTLPFLDDAGTQIAVYDNADAFAAALHDALKEGLARNPPTILLKGQKMLIKNGDAWIAARDYVQSDALFSEIERAYETMRKVLEKEDAAKAAGAAAKGGAQDAQTALKPFTMPKLADGKNNVVMYVAMVEKAMEEAPDRDALRLLVERETPNLRSLLPGARRTLVAGKGLPRWQALGGAPEEWSLIAAKI